MAVDKYDVSGLFASFYKFCSFHFIFLFTKQLNAILCAAFECFAKSINSSLCFVIRKKMIWGRQPRIKIKNQNIKNQIKEMSSLCFALILTLVSLPGIEIQGIQQLNR